MAEEKRLYNRGKDLVDLDDYVRLANIKFENWLSSIKGTAELKESVRKAYEDIIQRISSGDGTVSAITTGFNDSTGKLKNTPVNGFDAYGIAAGFLGNTLRSMLAYTKPESSNKDDYSTILRDTLSTLLFGKKDVSQETLSLWNLLDDFSNETNARTTNNRIGRIKQGIAYIYNNWDDLMKGLSEEEKTKKRSELESKFGTYNKDTDTFTGGILEDNNISENEYLDFSRIFGINPEKLLFTGKTVNPSEELVRAELQNQYYQDFNNYFSGIYNPDSVELFEDFLLSNTNFDFSSTTDLNIYNLTLLLLKGENIYSGKGISIPLALGSFLNKLKSNSNYLQNIGNGLYYIFNPKDEYTLSGYVWDSNTNILKHLYFLDIPYWEYKYVNDYHSKQNIDKTGMNLRAYEALARWTAAQRVPTNKLGGILKALSGLSFLDAITYLEEDLKDEKRLRNIYLNDGTFKREARNNVVATDNTVPGNNKYDPESGGEQLELQLYYKDWLLKLTTNLTLAEAWARRYKALLPTSNVHYNSWFNNDDSFNFENFKKSIGDSNVRVYDDKVNGIGHDIYRGRVYQIVDLSGKPVNENEYYLLLLNGYELLTGEGATDDSNPLATVYKMVEKLSPEAVSKGSETTDNSTVTEVNADGSKSSDLLEVKSEINIQGLPDVDRIREYTTPWYVDATNIGLNAGRLFDALHTNAKNKEILLSNWKTLLKDPWYVQTPVRGDLRGLQTMQQQGAEAISLAGQMQTSDANLAAAKMLESWRINNEATEKGYSLYNKTWKDTFERMLSNIREGVKNRTETTNLNKDLIDKNRKERALIRATANLLDKNARDLFSQDLLTIINTRFNERATNEKARLAKQKEWTETNINNVVAARYLPEKTNLTLAMAKFRLVNPVNYAGTEEYQNMARRLQELEIRSKNDAALSTSKLYGFDWNDLYKDNPYVYKDWLSLLNI